MTVEAYDEQGDKVGLPILLGRGGEGAAYAVEERPDVAAKVFYSARRTPAKHDKIQAMVARPPAGAYEEIRGAPVLTWPRALLYASATRRDASTFLGYTMSRVRREQFVPFYKVTSATRRAGLGGTTITFDRLVRLGVRLCHVVRTLHDFGYAVGDLNDRNVLVSRRLTPLFMDTDSFQVPKPRGGHFPSIVGDQMYWAPELLDVDLATHRGSRVLGDRYALGVLLFQLLMNGLRPYQARGSQVDGLETLAEKTRAGHYPWTKPKPGVLEPPAGAPDYRALPKDVRRAFERCFVDGHGKPKRRPTPHEWYDVLFQVNEAGYRNCSKDSAHVYAKEFRSCPWCKDPNDPFSAPGARPRRGRKPTSPSPPKASTRSLPATPSRRTVHAKTHTGRSRPPQIPLPPSTSQTRLDDEEEEPEEAAAAAAPLADRWYARLGWAVLLLVLFASPIVVLQQVALSQEKVVVTAAATMLGSVGLCLVVTWRWIDEERRAAVAGFASIVAAVMTGLLVWWEWWEVLEYATGAASLGLGVLVFVWLERRRSVVLRPGPRGLVHGAVALAAAYLPLLVLGIWLLL